MRRTFQIAAAAVVVALPLHSGAQAAVVAAQKADVATLDGLVTALYACISGPAGVDRQWDRFRTLFAPGARLIPTRMQRDSTWTMSTLTVDEYIGNSGGLTTNGFFEKEVARKSDRFGNIVQMFSTYESRRAATDEKPFARGINSIQARFDGTRWWIVTVFWQAENALHPIPPEYLPRGRG